MRSTMHLLFYVLCFSCNLNDKSRTFTTLLICGRASFHHSNHSYAFLLPSKHSQSGDPLHQAVDLSKPIIPHKDLSRIFVNGGTPLVGTHRLSKDGSYSIQARSSVHQLTLIGRLKICKRYSKCRQSFQRLCPAFRAPSCPGK